MTDQWGNFYGNYATNYQSNPNVGVPNVYPSGETQCSVSQPPDFNLYQWNQTSQPVPQYQNPVAVSTSVAQYQNPVAASTNVDPCSYFGFLNKPPPAVVPNISVPLTGITGQSAPAISPSPNVAIPAAQHQEAEDKRAIITQEEVLDSLWGIHKHQYDEYRKDPSSHPDYELERKLWNDFMNSKGFLIESRAVHQEWDEFWKKLLEERFKKEWNEKKKKFMHLPSASDRPADKKRSLSYSASQTPSLSSSQERSSSISSLSSSDSGKTKSKDRHRSSSGRDSSIDKRHVRSKSRDSESRRSKGNTSDKYSSSKSAKSSVIHERDTHGRKSTKSKSERELSRETQERKSTKRKSGRESSRESHERKSTKGKSGRELRRESLERKSTKRKSGRESSRESHGRKSTKRKSGRESSRESHERKSTKRKSGRELSREKPERKSTKKKSGRESSRENHERKSTKGKSGRESSRESPERKSTKRKSGRESSRESHKRKFTKRKSGRELSRESHERKSTKKKSGRELSRESHERKSTKKKSGRESSRESHERKPVKGKVESESERAKLRQKSERACHSHDNKSVRNSKRRSHDRKSDKEESEKMKHESKCDKGKSERDSKKTEHEIKSDKGKSEGDSKKTEHESKCDKGKSDGDSKKTEHEIKSDNEKSDRDPKKTEYESKSERAHDKFESKSVSKSERTNHGKKSESESMRADTKRKLEIKPDREHHEINSEKKTTERANLERKSDKGKSETSPENSLIEKELEDIIKEIKYKQLKKQSSIENIEKAVKVNDYQSLYASIRRMSSGNSKEKGIESSKYQTLQYELFGNKNEQKNVCKVEPTCSNATSSGFKDAVNKSLALPVKPETGISNSNIFLSTLSSFHNLKNIDDVVVKTETKEFKEEAASIPGTAIGKEKQTLLSKYKFKDDLPSHYGNELSVKKEKTDFTSKFLADKSSTCYTPEEKGKSFGLDTSYEDFGIQTMSPMLKKNIQLILKSKQPLPSGSQERREFITSPKVESKPTIQLIKDVYEDNIKKKEKPSAELQGDHCRYLYGVKGSPKKEVLFTTGTSSADVKTSEIAIQKKSSSRTEQDHNVSISSSGVDKTSEALEILCMLRNLSSKFGVLADPISFLYDKLLECKNRGDPLMKCFDEDAEMLLNMVKSKLNNFMTAPGLSIIQSTIYQETYRRLSTLLEEIEDKQQSVEEVCGLNIKKIAVATQGNNCADTIAFIKTALLYEGLVEVSSDRLMEVYLATKALQASLVTETKLAERDSTSSNKESVQTIPTGVFNKSLLSVTSGSNFKGPSKAGYESPVSLTLPASSRTFSSVESKSSEDTPFVSRRDFEKSGILAASAYDVSSQKYEFSRIKAAKTFIDGYNLSKSSDPATRRTDLPRMDDSSTRMRDSLQIMKDSFPQKRNSSPTEKDSSARKRESSPSMRNVSSRHGNDVPRNRVSSSKIENTAIEMAKSSQRMKDSPHKGSYASPTRRRASSPKERFLFPSGNLVSSSTPATSTQTASSSKMIDSFSGARELSPHPAFAISKKPDAVAKSSSSKQIFSLNIESTKKNLPRTNIDIFEDDGGGGGAHDSTVLETDEQLVRRRPKLSILSKRPVEHYLLNINDRKEAEEIRYLHASIWNMNIVEKVSIYKDYYSYGEGKQLFLTDHINDLCLVEDKLGISLKWFLKKSA